MIENSTKGAMRVWDLPLRLFHWSLVICVVGAFVTIQVGGNWVEWHFRFGYAALALILFRILWGLFGDRYSRFSSFFHGPASILAYLRASRADQKVGNGEPEAPGHNPLGSLSVFAMIAFLFVQPVLGLFANDDIASEGPLAKFVSKSLSDTLTGLHHRGELVLFVLVGMHVAAIIYYLVARKKNLVRPMISGDSPIDANTHVQAGSPVPQPALDNAGVRIRALVLMAISAAIVYVVVTL